MTIQDILDSENVHVSSTVGALMEEAEESYASIAETAAAIAANAHKPLRQYCRAKNETTLAVYSIAATIAAMFVEKYPPDTDWEETCDKEHACDWEELAVRFAINWLKFNLLYTSGNLDDDLRTTVEIFTLPISTSEANVLVYGYENYFIPKN